MAKLDLISDFVAKAKAFVLKWRNGALIALTLFFLALGIINSLFGSVMPAGVLPGLQIISFGLALNIIVPLIIDMHQRVTDRHGPKEHMNLRAAFGDILAHISAQAKANNKAPLKIQIVGMRLGTLADLLTAIAEKHAAPGANKRAKEITVYHVDPGYLEKVHLKY